MAISVTYTVTVLLDVNAVQDIDDRAESRTYIVADRDSGKAVIIDADIENVERDLKTIKELGLILTFAVETHIHADHITGASIIRDRIGAKIVYGGGVEGLVTGVDMFLHDGQELRFGNTTMQALATPGHTDSCTSYLITGTVFSGDSLLIRGNGRTDFQGGSAEQLFDSVRKKLFVLPDDTIVYPGHDYNSRVSQATVPVPNLFKSFPPQPTGAPVLFEDETLFVLYDTMGAFTPQERAHAIIGRLILLSQSPQIPLDKIETTDLNKTTTVLIAGDYLIMGVTDGDAQPLGRTRQEIVKDYATKIQTAVTKSRKQVTFQALLIDTGLALLNTIIFIAFLFVFYKLFPKLYEKLLAWRGTYLPPIKIQSVEMLSANQIASGLIAFAKGLRIFATLFLIYVWLTAVLGLFPWTRSISTQLLEAVVTTLKAIGLAFATYVPNVISIIIIIIVTRYIIKLISMVFTGMQRGAISFSGFHPEWTQPTYKIVRFLVIVFAAIAIFPYIPGSQSDAFRGVSVFLGVLFSFGSAGAISNIIAGVVLTYMNPFRDGDRVKIADTTGDVMERTLLVTRVRTIKNVDVSIPNSMVLSSHLINFSSVAKEQGLILHTKVTIGYDAPWKTVHELLISAARTTTHILKTPEPFVLQTSLDDFYVTYEINAYTDQANKMATIYAELHQNIQDKFNEAGVEIMSPHYGQIRDGNQTTIPEQYLPKNYQAPAFRIGPLSNLFGGPKDVGTGKGETQP